MTADYFSFPKKFLDNISNKIVNNVKVLIELFMILPLNHLVLLN